MNRHRTREIRPLHSDRPRRAASPVLATAAFALTSLTVFAVGFAPRTAICLFLASLSVWFVVGWRLGVWRDAGGSIEKLRERWAVDETVRSVTRRDVRPVKPTEQSAHDLEADAAATIADIERALGILHGPRRDRP
jgi:hypothetical protein